MALDIEQVDPSIGGVNFNPGEKISTNININNIIYFKDIIPSFLDSDRSGGSGFSNLNRLTALLHSWGFSDVDVSNVTEWKISGKNQYTSYGPRLEW